MKIKIVAPILCALLFLVTSCATTTSSFAPMKGSSSAAAPALSDFKLVGDLGGDIAAFTLTANVRVENPGGSIELLSGPVALTSLGSHQNWNVRFEQNRFIATFDRAGTFPVQIKFKAAVGKNDGWSAVDFRVAPSILQPIVLQGLPADTQFQFANAARPERTGTNFTSFLQVDGSVRFSWKQARAEAEGKLFYAAEMESQISISPGLMRQVALLDGKVMQGEMNQITVRLHGDGEVTRVAGDQVLAWNVVPVPESDWRLLVVQFNQPQKDGFEIQVQTQTPLGAFPQSADAMQIQPEGATRFSGHFRVVNDGAVRLEVLSASGLSQISPEQFPESDATRAAFRATGSQRFAYQFSSPDFALKIQADQILPEVSVSQLLAYNLGESELAIDAEIELDIRDAPLRELVLNVPKGYSVASLNASSMSDYFLRDGEADSELRIVYGQPVSDRQAIQLRLERNQALGETNWTLPRIEVAKAKSTRGFVAVSADAGFRLTAERTQSLTETPTAFFPRKVAGIQTAFRLSDADWRATMRVERLPQTISADAFHLFSIGEGIAYGSSVMNYVVSGAPVSAFRVELSDEYFNVEFTGKDIRGWQKTTDGYVVQLNTPVSGAYTLLATYERPFKPAGETLAFTGARPLDAQTEQGHTIIISAYQFQVKAVDVSPGLVELEPAEVPSEYRLFFDAPILKAYQYSARAFDLKLALSPLAQGDSLNQVVDRASLDTSISKEGQVLTTIRYFVKNRGNPNFRLTLPDGTDLWSATVNGATVVPVIDGKDNLIPLPQRADPDKVLTIDLKLAATNSDSATRVTIAAPIVSAPVMLAQWKIEPDQGQRLDYLRGSLTPVGGVADVSGFAQLARLFKGNENGRAVSSLFAALVLLLLALFVWRWAAREGVYKFSAQHIFGTMIGLAAVVLAAFAFVNLVGGVGLEKISAPRDVTFLAPVQQAGSALTVEVANVSETASTVRFGASVLLLAVAVVVLIIGRVRQNSFARILGWLLLAWAALRWQNGAAAFFVVVAAFLICRVVIPALKRLCQLPEKPESELPPPPEESGAPRAVALLIGLLLLGSAINGHSAGSGLNSYPRFNESSTPGNPSVSRPVLAETVTQQIRIEDKFALATAKIRWQAEKGQVLPILFEPAVMTKVTYPVSALKLVQTTDNSKRVQQLIAQSSGTFDIEVQYQIQVTKLDNQSGFALPVPGGLINQLNLTLVNLDVDVYSPQAVSVQRTTSGTNTIATLVLAPGNNTWVSWQPRSRDVKNEKPVFYAEISQLYVPSAGVIEGSHFVSIRPAQGELSELIFNVPAGATITDVFDGRRRGDESQILNRNSSQSLVTSSPAENLVSLWRFDPDTRKLRVTLNPAQSRIFALVIRSQIAAGTLPFERKVGLISVDGAAGQIGLVGVATGNEVQLDNVTSESFSAINLEDFPNGVAQPLAAQFPGLTVRRAFSYSEPGATAVVKASPVEPDVRVETQDTISLGEDRTVLASTANVNITRAGIFKLSFVMPPGFDVESISGAALSHWTELKTNADRVITLNLSGKTDGQQQFTISLSGPGVKATNGWTVPQLVLREAGKQRGTLLIVPEQGMRLSATNSIGVTQLDPQKSGVRQQGVLAFRVLQSPWNLALDIEQVDAWVQVTSLQTATVNEAQVKIAANLQYQIENTGLKAFHVLIPTNAIGVNFQGDQIAGFQQMDGVVTNDLQEWEIKLQRRVIGQYLLQLTYQTPMPDQSAETILRGVQVADVNTQRGFVTVQSGGRLQVRADDTPASLQPAEWQSIPRALQQDLETVSASFAYRLVEADFQLPLKLERHEAAKLLPARVNNITFTSVISDAGVMLTEARLEILPGDKRLLHLTLPENVNAKFWFAFVNQNGVWPWREGEDILIPLEQQSRGDQAIPVEIYFSSDAGKSGAGSLDLKLLAPKFDLPLEDITWKVYLNDKWKVKKWNGTLQLQQQEIVSGAATLDLQNYLSSETSLQQQKTQEAQQMLSVGNSALQNGDPQQARRAFQSAYGLSRNDAAFNEDARVQLNNLKVQQALVGLNARQNEFAGANNGGGNGGGNIVVNGTLNNVRNNYAANYTQQDAKQIIDSNSADENAAFMKLAERLVQQQDAAVSSPAVIRANIPEQGRLLTFKRSVDVNREADLNIGLQATEMKAASWGVRLLVLVMTTLVLGGFGCSRAIGLD